MKYSELIQFEPIETIVQLRSADAEAEARRFVESFVISDRMAELFCDHIIPHLQFAKPADTKALLVVGNYGTGKSHLMATISAIAEHGDMANLLTSVRVAAAAPEIAGQFQVIRYEIGATTMSLRDSICGALEQGLKPLGVTYEFPASNERSENKTALVEMMAAFEAVYPGKGLLLVVDEMLEYLRTRRDQELILDLAFLREVGEVCKGTRFRFIGGVQETLFDNPRFQFVAESLRRVKDRFEQVRIVRDDIAYVVAARLLKKTPKQQALVREHLTKFAPLFGSMNERMDEFVRLYPVHPAYLDTFERVYVAEKREVLKTLSATMRRIIDQTVPPDDTGLIAYDSYWPMLRDNPSFRSVPEIREVIDKSNVLESRVQHAFPKAQYKPAAIRIIHALSVHRLTTSDIYAPLGATVEELRDDLCLLLPVPEKDAEFLRTVIETVLREILKTVSGQFLSQNRENGQYYVDLKKDVDFDSLIEKKAESLDAPLLDRYYFDALRRIVLEDPDAAPYVTGYKIWLHEIEWREKKAGRSGYLFFGAPNERSTAQPPRDFYLYFLQPFDAPYFEDERNPDEVFFTLIDKDDAFHRALRLYAGAREQAAAASGGNKTIYETKASEHLRTLTAWLRERCPHAIEVTYQGRSSSLQDVVRGKLPPSPTIRDYVDVAGAELLASHFLDLAKEYPTFSISIGAKNREQSTQEALRWLAGGVRGKQGTAVLDALELLDGESLRPHDSRYAKQVLGLLAQKAPGQVLNRSELVQSVNGVEYWAHFRLEPEFLAVVVAALAHAGDVVVSVAGKKLDASSVDELPKLGISTLREFKNLERPKDLPLSALQELCALLDVPKGLFSNPAHRDDGLMQVQQKTSELVVRVATALSRIPDLLFWGRPVLGDAEQSDAKAKLGALKSFLESLQSFNTVGKLKNLPHDVAAVKSYAPSMRLLGDLEHLGTTLQQIAPLTAYLGKAEALLPSDHPWQEDVRTKRREIEAKLGDPGERGTAAAQRTIEQALLSLKSSYQDAYLHAHQRARLGSSDDQRKGELTKDPRLARLRNLAGIDMMPAQQFHDLQNRLLGLKTCFSLGKAEIENDPLCPHAHCRFRPADEPAGPSAGRILQQLDDELDALGSSWTQTLLGYLEDPTVAANVDLISDAKGKKEIRELLKSKALPETISQHFLKAIHEVLSGLVKVTVTLAELQRALAEGGLPCTIEELRSRFERFLGNASKGKDPAKVRVVLE